MERVASGSRRQALWLAALSGAVLMFLAWTAPALERKSATQVRQAEPSAKQRSLETTPMPVQWQLDQLRARIQDLEGQVASLQQQAQQHGAAGSNVAGRLAALEGVIQISPNQLRLQSPGALEIKASGDISLDAGVGIRLKSASAEVNAPHLRVHGVAESQHVVTQSVVSQSYTPGAGNVW